MKLTDSLAEFGVASAAVHSLREHPSPATIRYLDLVREVERPAAVVEMQDQPVAYVVDGLATRPMATTSLLKLRRLLAFRGDAPYLALVRPGELTVYGIGLDDHQLDQSRILNIKSTDREAASAFRRLSIDPPLGGSSPGIEVHDLLCGLLTGAIEGLVAEGVDVDDAVSLAGRALFTRFLLDRSIISQDNWAAVCPKADAPEEFFADWKNSVATCTWLDQTFNGDFLPLRDFADPGSAVGFGSNVWQHLSNIMSKSRDGQLRLTGWPDVDFAHVPVGVLSEVYEQQAEDWDPQQRRQQGLYYTPRRLAEYMVSEVFRGLADRGPVQPHHARLLDPAVGGGVFLTTALRQLVAEAWRAQGRRPQTTEIRQILYRQLAGFDINEIALRLAALSLYLTAIELDPDPTPVETLRFQRLRDRVLFHVADSDAGSVTGKNAARHSAAYDVVIGNPPWTAVGAGVHRAMVDAVRPIAAGRLGDGAAAFQIPDHVPDLPFVWMSLAWAKPGGWLAFALHARVLFKETPSGRQARQDLFGAMTVTGVLNGADLAGTNVWPAISEPFCLLFGLNRKPADDYTFSFVSPYAEPDLNFQGRLRVDHKDAYPVSFARMRRTPGLLKAVFRGTTLDLALLNRVRQEVTCTVGDYWRERGLAAGDGYQIGSAARQVHDASFLVGLPDIGSLRPGNLLVGRGLSFPAFSHERAWRPRTSAIYQPPLVLVPESPAADAAQPRAYLSHEGLAFSESHRGYSAKGHARAGLLAEYLALLMHTRFYAWHLLLTSGKFGYERRSAQSRDVDAFPMVPLEHVEDALAGRVSGLLQEVSSHPELAWDITDEWAGRLYGLDEWEMQVVADTVDVGFPFAANRQIANRQPTTVQVEGFCSQMRRVLTTFGLAHNMGISVTPSRRDSQSPWQILTVCSTAELSKESVQSFDVVPRSLMDLAESIGASRVTAPLGSERGLQMAVLLKYRYWTPTRARLAAHEIIDQHYQVLFPAN